MSYSYVVKRNGSKTDFAQEKITKALEKAGKATNEFDYPIASMITKIIMSKLELAYLADEGKTDSVTLEFIQDAVEATLSNTRYKKTARAYAVYRDQRTQVRSMMETTNINFVDRYVNKEDWKIKENSNTTFSIQGLHHYMANDMSGQYWLNKIYPKEVRDAHVSGDFHIHDLGMLATYCCGWSLEDLLLKGFTGVPGKISSTPAKHFRTALGQLVNFLYTLQGEACGAQAVSNFDTLLAPFVRYDNLTYKQVRQSIQEFVFNMNVSTRVGMQVVFSNITLDLKVPSILANSPIIIGGERKEETYSEFQPEMNMINKAFVDVMIAGDASGRIFTFPIPTYNIDKEFDWDNEEYDDIFRVAGKYGLQYFANFVNSDMSPDDARSMCPLHENTEVRVRINNTLKRRSIKYLFDIHHQKDKIEALYKGKFQPVTIVEVTPEGFCEVTIQNVHYVNFEGRHEQPVKFNLDDADVKEIQAKDIKEGMYLPFVILGDDENFEWLPVTNVKHREPKLNEKSYCFVVLDGGEPYFQLANGLITHNCRLRIDNRELRKRGGGLFGANPLTGSSGVVTINLPRIGYLSNSEEEFIERLDKLIYLAKTSLIIKRKLIDQFTDKGMYPYSAYYLQDVKDRSGSCWANHFNTIGIIGMEEACRNLFGCSVGDITGKEFALRIMDHIRDRMIEFQEETGLLWNLEASPSESTSYSLALKDKKIYPDIITADSVCDTPYYTNSTHLPVGFTDDMFELLDLQDELQTKYTGGTVIHFFLGEELTDVKVIKDLIRKVCTNYKLPYFSLTPTFSTCEKHGYLPGKQEDCPTCGGETEIFSRVVGYYRPVKSWNNGKVAEFQMRKTFNVEGSNPLGLKE